MKSRIFTLVFALLLIVSCTTSQTKQPNSVQSSLVDGNNIYQLFPTKNYWTFIKLDTRNGKMWQVHFSVGNDNKRGELILNSQPLVNEENETTGRFTLYPTENMFNFLLLDQINGKVVQVQWSIEDNNRGIVSNINPID